MSKKYYYTEKTGVRKGPFDLEEIMNEPIDGATFIWFEGLSEWTELKDIPPLFDIYNSIRKKKSGKLSNHNQTETKPTVKKNKFPGIIIFAISVISILIIFMLYVAFSPGFFSGTFSNKDLRRIKSNYQATLNAFENNNFDNALRYIDPKGIDMSMTPEQIETAMGMNMSLAYNWVGIKSYEYGALSIQDNTERIRIQGEDYRFVLFSVTAEIQIDPQFAFIWQLAMLGNSSNCSKIEMSQDATEITLSAKECTLWRYDESTNEWLYSRNFENHLFNHTLPTEAINLYFANCPCEGQ